MEKDIVLTKHNDKEHIVQLVMDKFVDGIDFGKCMLYALDYKSGYNSYPMREVTFVKREFYDPEEIMA